MSAPPRSSFEWRTRRPGTFTPEQLAAARWAQATYEHLAVGSLRSPRLARESAGHSAAGPTEMAARFAGGDEQRMATILDSDLNGLVRHIQERGGGA